MHMNDQPRPRHAFRTSRLEEADGPGLNPTGSPTMGEIIAEGLQRCSDPQKKSVVPLRFNDFPEQL
jgi:hypothetical protein